MTYSGIIVRAAPAGRGRYEGARELAGQIEELLAKAVIEADPHLGYELRLARALTRNLIDQLAMLPADRPA